MAGWGGGGGGGGGGKECKVVDIKRMTKNKKIQVGWGRGEVLILSKGCNSKN